MSLRIACDLDGTVADMSAALQREAETLFGPGVTLGVEKDAVDTLPSEGASPEDETPSEGASSGDAGNVAEKRRLSHREYRRLWAHVGRVENFWCSLAEIEVGAVSRLALAAKRYRWEVIFLTQRPKSAGDLAQVQSQRWLEAHGFEFPSVFVVDGSRGKIAAALNLQAVVDDRPENCLDVATDSRALPILVWRGPRESAPPGAARLRVETVFSFAEALARLEALTARAAAPSGLVGRIRRNLGM